jgi:hypothetical protein
MHQQAAMPAANSVALQQLLNMKQAALKTARLAGRVSIHVQGVNTPDSSAQCQPQTDILQHVPLHTRQPPADVLLLASNGTAAASTSKIGFL